MQRRKRENRFSAFAFSRFLAFAVSCLRVFVFLCFHVFGFSQFRVFGFARFRVFSFLCFRGFTFSRCRVFSFLRFCVFAFSLLAISYFCIQTGMSSCQENSFKRLSLHLRERSICQKTWGSQERAFGMKKRSLFKVKQLKTWFTRTEV